MVKFTNNYYFFRRIVLPILLYLSFSFSSQAQLSVNNSLTPTQLVQTILLGSGVTASNITYNGVSIAIGDFNGSSSNIGLASGVIMSSGNISNAVGPNNTGNKSTSNYRPGDSDLDQIMSPVHSYDAAILEFDFVPISDTLKFRYVFGSEEYMEWVSPYPGGINDGFGFFISGPGISGTFTNNAKNIALIPGTALPVTMFNLNLNNHGAYYFDNGNGWGTGTAPNGQTVQYDGFTVPLTAVTAVQCGQTYHIKLVVGDGGDGIFDSGVFLEAGSFSSIGPPGTNADIAVNLNVGCVRQLTATNFNTSTITWNSIFPGAPGAYNSYLSCTSGCTSPGITPTNGAPPYVDYQACGLSMTCNPTTVCDTVRVTFNPPLTIAITPQTPVLCSGQSSIALTAIASGGSPPYNYLWNNVNPSQSITVGSGVYTVQLTDAADCPPVYSTVTVTSYSVSPLANAGTDQTVCSQNPITIINGSVNGASSGIWSGGTGTFTPNNTTLSGVSYSPTAAELAAGFVDLTLTTTGTGSCSPASDVVRINYVGFTETVSFTTTPVSCFGWSDGSATVTVTGTTPPYIYTWNTVPAQTSATATNLPLGTYSVTIKNGIGCTSTNSVNITQPQPLALASSVNQVKCSGGNDGSISLTPAGGTPPYTYSWNNGSTTSSIGGLTAQSYTVTVTDAKGCTITSSYTITEPAAITASISSTDVNCFNGNDGTVSSSVSGGTTPYTYNWSSGASSPNVSGLQAGAYTLTVTDFNQCSTTASATVNQPSAALLANITSTNIICNAANNGTATAIISGGTPGYNYLWQPGALISSSISNLPIGTYSLTVTDSKGCQTTAFATITEPAPLTVNFVSKKNVSCKNGNDGTVTASVLGGVPNYAYSWNTGSATPLISNLTAQGYTITVTDNSGCTATNSVVITEPAAFVSVAVLSANVSCYGLTDGSVSSSPSGGTMPYSYIWMPGNTTTQGVSNLAAGTYTVTVRDTLGCMATNSATVSQPGQMVLVTSSTNADCGVPNGQTSVSVAGGSGPYTYQWSPTGGTSAVATGLYSGAYTVMVTDITGCSATQWGNINENSPSSATILSATNISCNGGADGSITAGISGGIGPFTYVWTPSGGTDSIATGLAAGSYTITITDPAGCQSLATATITEPDTIAIAATTIGVTCFGGNDGTATASASGGTAGYTYQWLPGGITTATAANLSANTYTLQVTDANNCIQTATVAITEPALLTTIIDSLHNVSCFGGSDGAATITTSGGTPVYYYSWLPTAGSGTSETNLATGTYTVITMDDNGCSTFTSITITEPSQPLSATSNVSLPSCFGAATGNVSIHPTGGTPGYTYHWNPAVSSNDTASGLSIGNYTILVSDTNNCQVNLSVDITQSPALNGSLMTINPSCGLSNGSITPQVSGGSAPYTYLWSPGNSTNSALTNIGPGSYSILITDQTNCTLTLSATLNDSSPVITVSSSIDVSCNAGNDGSATIAISQGITPYSINWTPSGGNGLNASSLTAGTYTVSVTDATGCQIIDSVTITEPAPLNISVLSLTDVLCNGGSSGTISIAITGGTGPGYSYLWSPTGSTMSTATNLTTGTHTVTVTDQNGCTGAASATISEPPALSSTIDTIINPDCFGGFGSATVSAIGGVLPYTYLWLSSAETTSTADSLIAGTQTIITADSNGCTTSSNAVITEPSQVITTGGANDTLCPGQSTILSATATGGGGNYYYTWQPSGAVNSGTLNITPANDITYTVVAYDQLGCPGTSAAISAVVYSIDSSNIKAYATSPICLGQSSAVYVETYGQTGPLTYQWNNGLGNGTGLYTVTPSQNTTYLVTVTNSCGLSISDSVTVYITPPPTVDFVSDTTIVCAPGVILFTDSSVAINPNDPIITWNWNFGDGNATSIQNPSHTFNQAGNYLVSLTVTTAAGCTNNNSSAPLAITGIPSPTAVFSVNATLLNIPNDVLLLSNQSTGANTYAWTFGDGAASTQVNPQYAYTTVGNFQIQLIAMAQNGCMDTAYTQVTTDAAVTFPTAFIPNTDGSPGGSYNMNDLSNEVFFPYTTGVIEYKLEIYNRWGEMIFLSTDVKQGWDGYYNGKLCLQDVYVWKAYLKLNNGKVVNMDGNVTLLLF